MFPATDAFGARDAFRRRRTGDSVSAPAIVVLLLTLVMQSGCGGGAADDVSADADGVDTDAQVASLPAAAADGVLTSREHYLSARAELIAAEFRTRGISLSGDPNHVNAAQFLQGVRDTDLQHEVWRGAHPSSHSFVESRAAIQQTELYRVLRRMPKGAALHVHSSTAGDAEWVVEWMRTCPECFICIEELEVGKKHLRFGDVWFAPADHPPEGYLPAGQVLSEITHRNALVSLFRMEPGRLNEAPWARFNAITSRIGGLLNYQPLARAYFEHVFRSFAEDGIQHLELRSGFGRLFDLSDRKWSDAQFIQEYQAALSAVQKEHPHFTASIIMSGWRGGSEDSVHSCLERTLHLVKQFPDFVVGFDLVGCEQSGRETEDDLEVWLQLPKLSAEHGVDLHLFLHDGEASCASDMNLFDAYLLRSRRIGHGINLDRFPELEERIAREGTALEICPISNQILGYVTDLRQHPADGLIRRGVTCTLSPDDPLIFGNHGMTYDFWAAVVAWELTLPEVREICRDSIEVSTLTGLKKTEALLHWEAKWLEFELWLARGAPKQM